MAKFLELALDTVDPRSTIAEFWAPVVGGRAVVNDPRYPADVVGETEQQGISVCPVPEPKTVKNRVHLDIYSRTVDELVARGATVQLPAADSGFPWTVMLDPDPGPPSMPAVQPRESAISSSVSTTISAVRSHEKVAARAWARLQRCSNLRKGGR